MAAIVACRERRPELVESWGTGNDTRRAARAQRQPAAGKPHVVHLRLHADRARLVGRPRHPWSRCLRRPLRFAGRCRGRLGRRARHARAGLGPRRHAGFRPGGSQRELHAARPSRGTQPQRADWTETYSLGFDGGRGSGPSAPFSAAHDRSGDPLHRRVCSCGDHLDAMVCDASLYSHRIRGLPRGPPVRLRRRYGTFRRRSLSNRHHLLHDLRRAEHCGGHRRARHRMARPLW